MGDPTVPYKIRANGYKISGDVRSGYHASVPYIVAWKDAFKFVDDVFGAATAVTVGPITWKAPYKFPASNADLYAQRFTLEPCGIDGTPVAGTNKGLAPGEFFSNALITVEFDTPPEIQAANQGAQHQLNPNQPITMCEQAVKITMKVDEIPQGALAYSGGTTEVKGETAVLRPEVRLDLTFPRVPYLPWALVQPYIGTLNDTDMLNCKRGTLLLEGMDSKAIATSDGISQQLVLSYAYSTQGDWNKVNNPQSGQMELVYFKGGPDDDTNRPCQYKNHLQIFSTLTYVG